MTRIPVFLLLLLGHLLALPPAVCAEAIDKAALQQIVGQKILVGFLGHKNTDPDYRRVLRNLEQGTVGGVLFLGRNVSSRSELEAMVREIRNCKCASPPLIAIDEEGGTVERLGEAQGFNHTASAAEVAKMDDERAKAAYGKLADKLSGIGFNFNLAPVVDLNVKPTNPIIGIRGRSFSNSPSIVSRYASIFIDEHHKRGIATALKHFPGHGSSSSDSHDSMVDVAASWSPSELAPYETLIGSGMADCIMVGHLSNASRWGGAATQDRSTAIAQMLRSELKFGGVVLSDDLDMKALRSPTTPLSETIKSSVRAGVDMVIVSRLNDDDETSDTGSYANAAIVGGILAGEIDRRSVADSAKRIERLKRAIADKFVPRAKPEAK